MTRCRAGSLRFQPVHASTWSGPLLSLLRAVPAPAIAWPADRIRRVLLSDVGVDDEVALPSVLPRNSSDEQILSVIVGMGGVRTAELAEAARISRQAAYLRLVRLERGGHLQREGGAWRPIAS